MKRIQVGDVELNVVERGRGEPILFVHGFPLDHTMWQHQLDALSGDFHVIAHDLRGFGQSQGTAGTVTMEQFSDDLANVLEALGVARPVTFCGLSMGGYIAWQFWRRYPHRLKALIQCDTKAAADKPDVARGRLDSAQQVVAEGPEKLVETMIPRLFAESTIQNQAATVDSMRRVMLSTPREGIAAALRGMACRTDVTAELSRIQIPTLAICGVHDKITPAAEMRDMAAAMPNAKFVEIADAGHMSPLEQPAIVNKSIRSFLDGLVPERTSC